MNGAKLQHWSLVLAFIFSSVPAWAAEAEKATVPNCPAYSLKAENGGDPGSLPLNNSEVLKWKSSTANQFHSRGHVQGEIVHVYPDRNGHEHFSIRVGGDVSETLEVVYNQAFGAIPDPKEGMLVEACGDYITSTGASPGPNGQVYPASPDGAIIHWIHFAPSSSGHHSGYMMIDGVLGGSPHGRPEPKRSSPHFRNNR